MYQPEGEGRARARRIISGAGYKCGGHFAKGGGIRADEIADKLEITKAIHEHEGALHPGSKKTPLRLADGGVAGGGMPMGRADRASRGRKGKEPKTHVNIIVAPQGDKAGTEGPPSGGPPMGAPPMMPPRPPPPPMAPPTGAPPLGVGAPMGGAPPMPARPPVMPPPGMPSGAPPMMRKAGGRTGRRHLQDGGGSGDPMAAYMRSLAGNAQPAAASPDMMARMQGNAAGATGAPVDPAMMARMRSMPAGGPPAAPPPMSMVAPAGAGPGMGAAPPAGFPQGYAGGVAPTPAQLMASNAPQARKSGGRAGRYSPPDMEAGAGSGAGRLDKIGKDEPSYGR